MARKQPDIRMVSFGLYTSFDPAGDELPKVREFTTNVPAEVGTEFGYILEIRRARGQTLSFTIEHPPFVNDAGQVTPPFDGEQRIPHSEYQFFLGDCIWAPPEDKVGDWTLITRLDGQPIAEKTFTVR
jgi:hypothetical protein